MFFAAATGTWGVAGWWAGKTALGIDGCANFLIGGLDAGDPFVVEEATNEGYRGVWVDEVGTEKVGAQAAHLVGEFLVITSQPFGSRSLGAPTRS